MMNIDIVRVLIATLVASVVWFVLGAVLYMNPMVSKYYKSFEAKKLVKKWSSMGAMMGFLILIIVVQSFLWAVVYAFIKPVLPTMLVAAGLLFGLILIVTKNIPEVPGHAPSRRSTPAGCYLSSWSTGSSRALCSGWSTPG